MMVICQVTVASWLMFSSVNPASLPHSSEPASWCILELDSGTMPDMLECSFDNPVKTIQLDYYSHDLPEVAVSCYETCDVSTVLSTMFRVSSVHPRLLTIDILQVSPRNAGRYRCQATQEATQLTVEGKCSTATGKGTEGEDEDNYLYFLPIVAIVPIALLIAIVVCKVKSCGFWKSQSRPGHEHQTSSEGNAEHPEKESLTSPPDEQTSAASEGRMIDRQEVTTIGAAADDVTTPPSEMAILLPKEYQQSDSESSDKEQWGLNFPGDATGTPPLSPLEKVEKMLEGEGHSPEDIRRHSLVNEQVKCKLLNIK